MVGVETFHVLIFCLVVLCHRASWQGLSGFIFLALLVLMYFAQHLNKLAAERYALFSREQYFDSDGLFITLIVLLPCTINCILFIVSTWEEPRGVALLDPVSPRPVKCKGGGVDCEKKYLIRVF